jgi:pilus assembly protein CpaE
MATQVVLVTDDAGTRVHLTHVLAEADAYEVVATVSTAQSALEALTRHADVGLIVIDADADGGQGHAIARRVGAVAPLVGVVMVGEDAGPGALAAAMEVGARSVVPRGAGLPEFVARFEAVAQWSSSARAAIQADQAYGGGGRVIAVAGAKGGVGTSTVALLLAAAAAGARTVTLVDFDLAAGDLTAFVGVHTRRSVIDLADVAGEITGRMLRETSYDVTGGIRLLPAPNEGERGEEMTAAAARGVVNALRFESDVAVIDVGSRLDDATAAVLEYADVALLVTTPDLPALRAARRTIVQWERLAVRPQATVDLVLNRRSGRDQVTTQLAQRVVERPVTFLVPQGGDDFSTAMNTATLLEGHTAVHESVGRLAGAVIERTSASEVTSRTEPDGEQELEKLLSRGARGEARPRSKARRKRGRRPATDHEAGQSTVELPVVMLLGLVIFLLCAQGIMWAAGLMVAHSAAEGAARTVGINSWTSQTELQARQEVHNSLPRYWDDHASVTVGSQEVRVKLAVPTVIPGATLTATVTADVYREP